MTNEELIAFLRKNVISVACFALSAVLFGVKFYLSDEIPDAEKSLAEITQKGELLSANIEDSSQLKEQYSELVASNSEIADRLIHVGQLAENLEYFYRLESDTGVKIPDPHQIPGVPPGKNAIKTNFVPVGFNLAAQGDYAHLIDLLRRLESGDHYCRILTCNIKPTTEIRGGLLQMTIALDLLGVQ
jgi:hypothetical protein